MTMTRRFAAGLALIASLVGCGLGYLIGEYTGNRLLTIDYCKVPGIDCPPKPAEGTLAPLKLCCEYLTHDCVIVIDIVECHPLHEYAVICEWGRSTADGIECYY